MKINACGQVARSESELLELFRINPEINLTQAVSWQTEQHNAAVAELYSDLSLLVPWSECADPAEYHQQNQTQWRMPESFQQLDIAELLISRCTDSAELERMSQELILFQDLDLFPLLRYLHWMVTVFAQNNIVVGVGRGSSVASFALYKLGVHRINSLKWNLDITEFLK